MNNKAIVTGANSAIGREVVKQLAADGWSVLAVDLEVDSLADMERESSGRITPHQADVSSGGAAEKIVAGSTRLSAQPIRNIDMVIPTPINL